MCAVHSTSRDDGCETNDPDDFAVGISRESDHTFVRGDARKSRDGKKESHSFDVSRRERKRGKKHDGPPTNDKMSVRGDIGDLADVASPRRDLSGTDSLLSGERDGEQQR